MEISDKFIEQVIVFRCIVSLQLFLDAFCQKSAKPWQPSGYLVFSAESRKQVQEENPDLTFGDISKVVGQKVCVILLEFCAILLEFPLTSYHWSRRQENVGNV